MEKKHECSIKIGIDMLEKIQLIIVKFQKKSYNFKVKH